MKKGDKIKIEIETYLIHPDEIISVAEQIKEMCKKGFFDYRGDKFSFRTLVLTEPEYRERIIDNKVVHVYQSKMNKK